ncbi:MAG: carbohydrate porin [Verrucomicrobia bacterium]|nr:carbohydrate porin [Verrucomicrobiota bacterium]
MSEAAGGPAASASQEQEAATGIAGPGASSRDRLTGDWGGARTSLEERGFTIRGWFTQFIQGPVSGGRSNRASFGSKLNIDLSIDGEKAGLWEGLRVDIRAEGRFGDSATDDMAALLPVSFAMSQPSSDYDGMSIPNFKITQRITDRISVFAGRALLLDGYRNAFAAGMGETAFVHTALVAKPVLSGQMSYSAWTAGSVFSLGGGVSFKSVVQDPHNVPTTLGLDTLGDDGVTLLQELSFPTRFGGLPGSHIIDFTWSNKERTSLDRNDAVVVPEGGVVPGTKDTSWGLYYQFDQFLWVVPGDESRGWGIFGQLSVSDGNPDPIEWFTHFGVSGVGNCGGRPRDRWGVGYFYAGLSDTLKRSLSSVLDLRDEQGFEAYYSIAMTPACHLTPDIQFVRAADGREDWTTILGLRVRLEF